MRRLRVLEEENRKLKQLVADLSLDKQMLQDVLRKSPKACLTAAPGRTWLAGSWCNAKGRPSLPRRLRPVRAVKGGGKLGHCGGTKLYHLA